MRDHKGTDRMVRGPETVLPSFIGLETGSENAVIGVVAELCTTESAGVGCDKVNVTDVGTTGEISSNNMVGGVGFDYERKRVIDEVKYWY
jgi:hypothetical protein